MENCARRLNYHRKEIVRVVEVASIVLLKAMKDTRLLVTENGAGRQKPRSAKRRAHNSSFSISID